MMVLRANLRCVAVNGTLWSHVRHGSDGTTTVQLPRNPLAFKELGPLTNVPKDVLSALHQSLAGTASVIETAEPPIIGAGQGQWKLHFLPFFVASDRGILVLFEDVTEQRVTSEAFQAAEQRFRLLVDSAADGIVIHRSQILLYANPEAVRLLGYQSPDELVGRPLGDLIDGDYRARFDLHLGEDGSPGPSEVFETMFLRKGGVAFPAECRATQARMDEMGAGFLFFRDILERKRQQSRRENARRVESLARLSATVASELHTFATRLKRLASRTVGRSGEPRPTNGTEIEQLAEDLNLRAAQFAQADVPTATETDPAALEELVGRVCSRLFSSPPNDGAEPLVISSSDVLIDLEPAEYVVRGDPAVIAPGMAVLVRAAWQARLSHVPLTIRGARLPKSDPETLPAYRLAISGGAPRKAAERAASASFPTSLLPFSAWEQARDLDLLGAIASLQAQGCWVEAHAGTRGGICFEVELSLDPQHSSALAPEVSSTRSITVPPREWGEPAVRLSGLEEVAPDTERSQATQAAAASRAESPVLICDDEARLVALTAGLLREFGFDVLTVRSGRDAVRTVMDHPVDVIVLDVNLPGEDARKVVLALQATRNIAVVLSSGYTEEDVDPLLLQEPSVKAFLSKPYTVDVLVQTIDRVRAERKATLGDGPSAQ
jgi:PAS domain S-box-containing protein